MAKLFPFRPESPDVQQEPRLVNLEDASADDVFAALGSETARAILARLYEEPATASDVAESVDTSLQNARYHLDKLVDAGLIEQVDTWYSSRGTEMTVYAPTNEPLVVAAGRDESTGLLREALKRVLGAVAILGFASLFVDRLVQFASPGGDGAVVGGGDDVDAYAASPGGAGEDEAAAGNGDGNGAGGDDGGDGADAAEDGDSPSPTSEEEADILLEAPAEPPNATSTAGDGTLTETAENGTVSPDGTPTGLTPSDPEGASSPTVAAADGVDLVDAASGLPPGVLFFAGGLLVIALAAGWWYTYRYRPAFA